MILVDLVHNTEPGQNTPGKVETGQKALNMVEFSGQNGRGEIRLLLNFLDPTKYKATVWLENVTNFSVDMCLPHQYKSNFAHLLDLYSLVIGL